MTTSTGKAAWLTKSRFMAGLQCPKRLWNEVHAPLDEPLGESVALVAGRAIDRVAQSMEPGLVISRDDGLPAAIRATVERLGESPATVLYQPAFRHGRLAVIADVLRPGGRNRYDLVEVKSSTKVKDEHVPDVAFQAMVLRSAGVGLRRVFIGHVNNAFVLEREGDYRGLLAEADVTREVDELEEEIVADAARLQRVLDRRTAPSVEMGAHCSSPYECPFVSRCAAESGAEIEYPVELLPRARALAEALRAEGYEDLRDVPAERLSSPLHRRIHAATRSGRADFDERETLELQSLGSPRAYLDFETIQFAVPEIVGTRPYEQLPFQWSLHVEDARGRLTHAEHLAVESFGDFARLAGELLEAVPRRGPVFVYNAGFERQVLARLAARLPRLAEPLGELAARLFDLLPVTQRAYYHPQMRGSWSIKSVLPTIAPALEYATAGEVRGGEAAQLAFLELRSAETAAARRKQLRADLVEYCRRDTLGLVVLRRFLCGEPLGM